MKTVERVALAMCKLKPKCKEICGGCEINAREAIAELNEWQPIETAPKDGQIIIGTDQPENDGRWWRSLFFWVDPCNAYPNGAWVDNNTPDSPAIELTHWLPLPPPPVTKT